MSQHTGSRKNSLNLLGEKYLNESHWPMRRIRLLECNSSEKSLFAGIIKIYKNVLQILESYLNSC